MDRNMSNQNGKVRVFSMFSGVGGFELGIINAIGKRADFIGFSEIDKYAIQTYEHNFGKEVKNYGDATTINTAELPDFDLLVGGFPCQAFSVAGKRAGFNDTRGTLIFDVVRILRDKRPRHFVLENVKGLLSHEGGKTFAHILEILTDSGYDVSWSVHNSKNYGVPQNRERIYLIGNLRGERRPQVFPITITDGEDTQDIGKDVAYTIDANYHKGTNTLEKSRRSIVQVNNPVHSNDRVYASDGISPTLNTMQGGNRQLFVKVPEATIKNPLKGKTEYGWHFEQNVYDKDGLTRTVKAGGGSGNTLKVLDDVRIRRLTPVECERLQGFPPGWTEFGLDTKELVTYKKCGNIEIWNKAQIEKIRNQYVRFRVVLENKKPISVIASCTTNDGSEMELPSCQNVNSNPKVSVHIVIDRLEESERWECVINTTKCGDSMVTRYTLRRNEKNQVEMAISETATGVTPTPKSWKLILEENLDQTKLYTISTQINWIIESLISTYAHAQSMELSMHNSDGLSKTESTWEISYLKTVSTERISDSSRYKQCGNAVTVNVVEHVIRELFAPPQK